MPYLPTAQSFLEQSTLLISARPSTTRVTTKYQIPHPNPPPHPYKPSRKVQIQSDSEASTDTAPPRQLDKLGQRRRAAHLQPVLVLKTYDAISGTCLKYRTDKAAEVGRLVAALSQCGRVMAALPLTDPELVGGGKQQAQAQEGDANEGTIDGVVVQQQQEEGGSTATATATTTLKEEVKTAKGGKAGTTPAQSKGGGGDGAGAGGGGGGAGGKKKKKGKK